MIFTPTEQERQAQAFDPDKLAAIVASIQTQGFAVVSDLVSPATCELLMQSVLEDADQVVANSDELTPTKRSPARAICSWGCAALRRLLRPIWWLIR